MLATLTISLLLAFPVYPSPMVGDYTPGPSYRTVSLDDCLERAANQLPRWKSAYTECVTKYLTQVTKSPVLSQLQPVRNVAIVTDNYTPDYEENPKLEVSTAYSVKRPAHHVLLGSIKTSHSNKFSDVNDRFNTQSGIETNFGREVESTSDVTYGQDGDANDVKDEKIVLVTNDEDNGSEITSGSDVVAPEKRADKRPDVWTAMEQRALYGVKKRRYHSLSINRALVALADMLIAREYSRTRLRQQAFRQHLSNLGR